LLGAVRRAMAAYREPARWRELRDRVMGLDHSWARPAAEYLDVYRDAIERHRRGTSRRSTPATPRG
jgi:starch synthase